MQGLLLARVLTSSRIWLELDHVLANGQHGNTPFSNLHRPSLCIYSISNDSHHHRSMTPPSHGPCDLWLVGSLHTQYRIVHMIPSVVQCQEWLSDAVPKGMHIYYPRGSSFVASHTEFSYYERTATPVLCSTVWSQSSETCSG